MNDVLGSNDSTGMGSLNGSATGEDWNDDSADKPPAEAAVVKEKSNMHLMAIMRGVRAFKRSLQRIRARK